MQMPVAMSCIFAVFCNACGHELYICCFLQMPVAVSCTFAVFFANACGHELCILSFFANSWNTTR